MIRRFSTADLENLTEGITPGKLHRDSTTFRDQRSHSVKSESGMVRAHTGYGPDGGTAYQDAELFAASRELAADYHRVRKALEAWLRVEQDVLNTVDPTVLVDQILIVGAQTNIKNIRRILNGDTNE